MRVDLLTIQPNPLRDFAVDPMDAEVVDRLRHSIEEDGFWGGVVCRQLSDGTIQIGAGHHRIAAAKAAGITEADLFVAEDMTDASMIRVYARENATQRGMSSTALAGSVASAMKYVARCILTGEGVAEKFFCNFDMPTVRRRLLGDDGMGYEVLLAFLDDIPGINTGSIKHQIANLKASGDYARLIAEVEQDIAAEYATQEACDLAHKAAQEASKHERTFDFQGVARHLKNAHQVDVFRGLVTKDTARKILPVDQQAPLAERLLARAREYKRDISAELIRQEFTSVLHGEKSSFRFFVKQKYAKRTPEEKRVRKLEGALHKFDKNMRGLMHSGSIVAWLLKSWPAEQPMPAIPPEFVIDLEKAITTLRALMDQGGFHGHTEKNHAKNSTPRFRKQQTKPPVSVNGTERHRLPRGLAHVPKALALLKHFGIDSRPIPLSEIDQYLIEQGEMAEHLTAPERNPCRARYLNQVRQASISPLMRMNGAEPFDIHCQWETRADMELNEDGEPREEASATSWCIESLLNTVKRRKTTHKAVTQTKTSMLRHRWLMEAIDQDDPPEAFMYAQMNGQVVKLLCDITSVAHKGLEAAQENMENIYRQTKMPPPPPTPREVPLDPRSGQEQLFGDSPSASAAP